MRPATLPLMARYQDWMALKTNLLWIYEGAPPNGGGGVFFPEYFSALLVLRGQVVVTQQATTLRGEAGQWIIPWPGFRQQEFSRDARLLSVRFQAHWPDGRALFEQGLGLCIPAEKFPRLEARARELLVTVQPRLPKNDPTLLPTSKFSSADFFGIKTGLLGFLLVFIDALTASGLKPTRLGTHDERVLQALSLLDLLPLATKLREKELAAKVGLGLSQFVRLFRAELGMTPKKYLELRRRESCKQLLVNSSIPLKQVSLELGFSHHSDFSYWFKRQQKMSPKTFRQKFPQGRGL